MARRRALTDRQKSAWLYRYDDAVRAALRNCPIKAPEHNNHYAPGHMCYVIGRGIR